MALLQCLQDLQSTLKLLNEELESANDRFYDAARVAIQQFESAIKVVVVTSNNSRAVKYLEEQLELFCKTICGIIPSLLIKAALKRHIRDVITPYVKLRILWQELQVDNSYQCWDLDAMQCFWTELVKGYSKIDDDYMVECFPRHCSRFLWSHIDVWLSFIGTIPRMQEALVDPSCLAKLLAAHICERPSVKALGDAYKVESASVMSSVLSFTKCATPSEMYQRALNGLIAIPECRQLIIRSLDSDRIHMMEVPTEGILWLMEEFTQVATTEAVALTYILEQRISIVQRLLECTVDPRFAGKLGDIISTDKVADMYFGVMCPDMFCCANLDEALDGLTGLVSYLSQKQCFYFFKKSLRLACVLPPHSALWLICFARILLERAPGVIIPTFHVNPTYHSVIGVTNQSVDLSVMPTDYPSSEAECDQTSDISITQQRCAKLQCHELFTLQHHINPAIKNAALDLTASVGNPAKLLDIKESQAKALSTSMLQIVNGSIKRAIKRIEVSTELFS